MNFKEYFEEKNIEDQFIVDLLVEYGAFDAFTAPLRFAGAGGANLINQNRKALVNVGKGVIKGVKGLAKIGAGGAQILTGDPIRGVKTAYKGGKDIASGAMDAGLGVAQSALSPVSAVVRGVQAGAEPMGLTSFDDKTTEFQNIFGFNSNRTDWEKAEERNNEFKDLMLTHFMLMDLYKKSKTIQEKKILKQKMKDTRMQMKEINPKRYEDLLNKAKSLQISHFASKADTNNFAKT